MDDIICWASDILLAALTFLKSVTAMVSALVANGFQRFQTFLESPLGSTIIGTAVAAFAGAYGAHVIAERGRRRESLSRELKVTNAAIMVSFEICNSFIVLKKQHIRGLKISYDAAHESFEDFEKKFEAGENLRDHEMAVQMDLMFLNPMVVPHEILVRQVFEEISAGARPRMLTSVLIRTVDSLNKSIEQRNSLIRAYQQSHEDWPGGVPSFYFGRPDRHGHVDMSYPQSMEAISTLTDDCIWFSATLCNDLRRHGETLRKQIGRRAEKVHNPNFSKAEEQGLMPESSHYHEWDWE